MLDSIFSSVSYSPPGSSAVILPGGRGRVLSFLLADKGVLCAVVSEPGFEDSYRKTVG